MFQLTGFQFRGACYTTMGMDDFVTSLMELQLLKSRVLCFGVPDYEAERQGRFLMMTKNERLMCTGGSLCWLWRLSKVGVCAWRDWRWRLVWGLVLVNTMLGSG